ncbi:MAG: diacylglycerol kinase family lipid kinase [Bacteroidales bacterium]|nr:diacylglycerol kinase family lipid kinase [Bacteroidales bacterium]
MKGSDRKDIWLVVVNVFAASRKAGSIWKKAAVMLEETGVPFKVRFTGGHDNAAAISRKACAEGYRKFIAVGGDGTVHDVLNGIAVHVESSADSGLSFSDFILGVLPVGSGNDWVKSTGVPRNIKGAVDAIAKGCTGLQDVVRVEAQDTVSYMANVGGVGLDARVCEIVNRKKEQGYRGKKLYVSALLYCIKNRLPVRARIVCDGKEVFSGKYLSIAFGVGKYSGGGMQQTPLAEIGDGLLDITVIPDIPMWTIVKEISKLFTGSFHKIDVLTMAKCKEVLVIPESEADAEPVEVDGEVTGRAPVCMRVLPQQINVIMQDPR